MVLPSPRLEHGPHRGARAPARRKVDRRTIPVTPTEAAVNLPIKPDNTGLRPDYPARASKHLCCRESHGA